MERMCFMYCSSYILATIVAHYKILQLSNNYFLRHYQVKPLEYFFFTSLVIALCTVGNVHSYSTYDLIVYFNACPFLIEIDTHIDISYIYIRSHGLQALLLL